MQLRLFTRAECHLCDEAQALIAEVTDQPLEWVDITASLALLTRYGTRIPVLQRTDSHDELDWPFDANAVAEFLVDRPTNPSRA